MTLKLTIELHLGDSGGPPDRKGQRLNTPAAWLLIDDCWHRLPYRSAHKARAAVIEALGLVVCDDSPSTQDGSS